MASKSLMHFCLTKIVGASQCSIIIGVLQRNVLWELEQKLSNVVKTNQGLCAYFCQLNTFNWTLDLRNLHLDCSFCNRRRHELFCSLLLLQFGKSTENEFSCAEVTVKCIALGINIYWFNDKMQEYICIISPQAYSLTCKQRALDTLLCALVLDGNPNLWYALYNESEISR